MSNFFSPKNSGIVTFFVLGEVKRRMVELFSSRPVEKNSEVKASFVPITIRGDQDEKK